MVFPLSNLGLFQSLIFHARMVCVMSNGHLIDDNPASGLSEHVQNSWGSKHIERVIAILTK